MCLRCIAACGSVSLRAPEADVPSTRVRTRMITARDSDALGGIEATAAPNDFGTPGGGALRVICIASRETFRVPVCHPLGRVAGHVMHPERTAARRVRACRCESAPVSLGRRVRIIG